MRCFYVSGGAASVAINSTKESSAPNRAPNQPPHSFLPCAPQCILTPTYLSNLLTPIHVHACFDLCTWCARQMRSKSWRRKNWATMSSPKVKETPRSFSPHPMMSLSGSDLIGGRCRRRKGKRVQRMSVGLSKKTS